MDDPLDKVKLAERLASETGMSLGRAKRLITGLTDEVSDFVISGRAVKIRGIGTFHVEHAQTPRMAFTPAKGASKHLKFNPSAANAKAIRNSNLARPPGPPVGPPPPGPSVDPLPPQPPPVYKETLIVNVAGDTDMSVTKARRGINLVTDEITKALKSGREVRLRGFGAFKPIVPDDTDE